MQSVFYPALGESTFRWIEQIREGKDEFWEWDKMLLSYHYWGKSKRPLPVGKAKIFGDSGGFSVVTLGANIDPRSVMRWQLRICDAGLCLDIPPYQASGSQQFAGSARDLLSSSIQRTRRNLELALPLYEQGRVDGSPFRWYGALQGETYSEIEMWWKGIQDLYPFTDYAAGEGWALAPKPSTDVIAISRYMRFAMEKGMKRIHVLQVTSARAVAVFLALAKLGEIEHVSFDSATAALYASNHKILTDQGREYGYIEQKTRLGGREVYSYVEEEGNCNCLGCKWYRIDAEGVTASQLPRYLLLHNYLVVSSVFQALEDAANEDPEGLLRSMGRKAYGDILREFYGDQHKQTSRKTVSIFERF